MSFELGPFRKTGLVDQGWWRGLPRWLKAVFLLGNLPAWLFIVYCVVTGQGKSVGALLAFAVFVACTVLYVIFDRRNR